MRTRHLAQLVEDARIVEEYYQHHHPRDEPEEAEPKGPAHVRLSLLLCLFSCEPGFAVARDEISK